MEIFKSETILYFKNNPNKLIWWNMDETGVNLDIRTNTTLTTIGNKSFQLIKSNDGEK